MRTKREEKDDTCSQSEQVTSHIVIQSHKLLSFRAFVENVQKYLPSE